MTDALGTTKMKRAKQIKEKSKKKPRRLLTNLFLSIIHNEPLRQRRFTSVRLNDGTSLKD